MFDKLINLISGDYNKKQIDKLLPLVDQTNVFYEKYDSLSDEEIKNKTNEKIYYLFLIYAALYIKRL